MARMMDPRLLFTAVDDIWGSLAGHRPVLVHLLEGYMDAGQVGKVIDAHLMEHCESELLAEFDHDQLHDYRARRPMMVFDVDHWESVTRPYLTLHRLIDDKGDPFLLLRGHEPDNQWDRLTTAVCDIVEELQVRLAATVAGAPMGVPHTRPLTVSPHATRPDLLSPDEAASRWAHVEVPASFSSYLEYALRERQVPAGGHFVHVPHYLAQTAYIEAAVEALERLVRFTGLEIPTQPLVEAAVENRQLIDAELANSVEAQEIVSALEERYDTEVDATAEMPSGDELAAEFERFLAEQPDKNDE